MKWLKDLLVYCWLFPVLALTALLLVWLAAFVLALALMVIVALLPLALVAAIVLLAFVSYNQFFIYRHHRRNLRLQDPSGRDEPKPRPVRRAS